MTTEKTYSEGPFKELKGKIAHLLVENKGFALDNILFDVPLTVRTKDQSLTTRVEILITLDGRPAMCFRIREGSVVSRERGAIAAARLLHPDYVIPICVQTNGELFSILDAITKKSLGTCWEDVPDRRALQKIFAHGVKKLPPERRRLEEKILYFYEALG